MSFFDMLEELQKPQVQQKPWMADVDLRLATVQDLDILARECIAAGHYGLDLECTGLDQRTFEGANGRKEVVDKITGFCIAPTINKGWYIPVRHTGAGSSANIPIRLVADMIRKIQAEGAKAVFHNGKFDQKLLDFDPIGAIGDWDNIDLWEDTLILAYLNDARAKNKGLKFLAKSLLDREMIELEQLFSPEDVKAKKLDFSTLDPTWPPVVWYAAADSVNTLALFHKLHASVVEKDEHGNSQKAIYRIEKACLRATLWMEDCRIYINREKLEDLIRLGQKEWWDCVNEVYDEACDLLRRDVRPHWLRSMKAQGYDPNQLDPNYMEVRDLAQSGSQDDLLPPEEKSVPRLDDPRKQESVKFPKVYDVTIPASLGQMLREAGVRGLAVTEKSNQVKTSKDELDRVIDEAGTDFPFMVKIKRFREVAKGLGTNLYPIWWDTTPKRAPDGSVWASFNGFKVDTGRFSTPTPVDKHRYHFHGQIRWGVHMTPATYDPTKPECVRRTRECVSARPGSILVAVDYSGVELRIVTNLAGEPKWVTEFFRCSGCDHSFDKTAPIPPFCPHCGSDKIGDLHTLTAIAVFGEHIKGTDDFKQRRQEAKCVYLDTEIITPSGPVRMGDLPFGPVDTFSPVDGVYVLGPKGEYIHVLETYNGGVKPLYQVVSESATLTCSAEHRFLLEDGSLQSISEGLGVGSFVQGAHGEIREILQIVPMGEHLCVDLHIDSDDHLYMANGFVTHNSLNFAMCYGGGGSAAQRAVGVNQEEGWRIKNQFDKTYKILQKWWDSQHRTARKQKYVTTAFGRKYPLPDIDHTDGGFRSKAERNSVNGPVQGSSADIMKLAMALLYKDFKARGWVASGRVKMIITIHDELVFEIQEENAGEVIDVIQRIMTQDATKALGWLVPLTVDIEFGDDWTVPYHLTKMAWNKSKDNKWSERWVRAFPSHYQHYLKCGGTPVEGAPPPSEDGVNTPPEPQKNAPSTPAQVVAEKEGSTYIYRVSRLTATSAEKLARVIHKCIDRGLDSLHIRDADGNDLFGGPLQVAYEEFRVVADYEGLR